MEQFMKNNRNSFKKLSDYIMTFAFLYASFLCFTEAAEKWENERIVAIIILVCGFFSFIAIFRYQIAYLISTIKNRKNK